MSVPDGSSAGLDGILPQILKDLTANSNGQTGLNFFKALTNLVNVILEGKIPFELQPYFFGAKLIGLKKPDGGLPVPDTMSSNHVGQDTEVDM